VPLGSVAGGVMGYMKSGSQKSLGAVGTSAMVLYFVYIQLPVRPVFASSIGLGMQIPFFSLWSFGNFLCLEVRPTWILSHDVVVDSALQVYLAALQVYLAALLSVMGSRFKKSGKMFPGSQLVSCPLYPWSWSEPTTTAFFFLFLHAVSLAFGVFKGLHLFYSSVDDLLTVPTG
jgi:hypothetical protein